MIKKHSIVALLCAVALAAGNLGIYADNAKAAQPLMTSDDAPLFREETKQRAEIGAWKENAGKTGVRGRRPAVPDHPKKFRAA